MSHVTGKELALCQAQGVDFELLDVRHAGVRREQGAQLADARWHDPAAWLAWKDGIGTQHPVVLYCAKDHATSGCSSRAARSSSHGRK